ncbi:hypothetical protein RHECNPAF_3340052 [Rhizobium etli CNPAF512]|nr:hypothetical protein RHECNPAF_3340052 [Rhizobium etli CNPAF512]
MTQAPFPACCMILLNRNRFEEKLCSSRSAPASFARPKGRVAVVRNAPFSDCGTDHDEHPHQQRCHGSAADFARRKR